MTRTLGVIGAGNMGEAMVGALCTSGTVPAGRMLVADLDADRVIGLQAAYGVTAASGNPGLFDAADIVILAVKPQQIGAVLSEIAAHAPYTIRERKIVISIAAGIRIRDIEARLYAPLDETARTALPVIRVMPNTPALVRSGMSGMSPNRYTTADDLAAARRILTAMGEVFECEETQLDAVTALSGSGPAYLFYLAEAMMDAGVRMGFSTDESRELVLATIRGAVRLMASGDAPPDELRRNVTSPGGTTEAAVSLMDAHRVKDRIVDAVLAAQRRSRELSGSA